MVLKSEVDSIPSQLGCRLGTYDFVLIWSVLNCLGVISESIGREIGRIPAFAKWQLGEYLFTSVDREGC